MNSGLSPDLSPEGSIDSQENEDYPVRIQDINNGVIDKKIDEKSPLTKIDENREGTIVLDIEAEPKRKLTVS